MIFNTSSLIICSAVTFICCYLLIVNKPWEIKLFYFLFYSLLFVYCGIGGSLDTVPYQYRLYYIGYVVLFTAVSYFLWSKTNKKSVNPIYQDRLESFIERYGKAFILIYLFLNLFSLIYPEFRLTTLFHPPTPDIQQRLEFYKDEDAIPNPLAPIRILVGPFFYWALYNYRKQLPKVIFILLLILYISYCAEGYASRGTILIVLAIIFFALYHFSSHKVRIVIAISSAIGIPFVLFLAVYYSYARLGLEAAGISLTDAVNELVYQECHYPVLFSNYYAKSGRLIKEFFEWLFLLPFPSFMKFGHGGTLFNETFTMVAMGKYPWESDFSISLPGLVGESIFIFKELFFIHAIVVAYTLQLCLRFVIRHRSMVFLVFYFSINFSFSLCRGGTQSIFSYIFKALLLFVIITYFIQRTPKKTKSSGHKLRPQKR